MKIPTIVRWVIVITLALLVCDRALSLKTRGKKPSDSRAKARARQFHRGSSKHPQISYNAAVFAIAHCLPEVNVLLEGRKRKELISRVLSVPLAGRAAPYGSADVLIDYELTVLAFARELEEQRAVTRMPYREVAERALRLPLEQSLNAPIVMLGAGESRAHIEPYGPMRERAYEVMCTIGRRLPGALLSG